MLAGPGGGAEPTVFVDDDEEDGAGLMMVVAMVSTPGGLGLMDHAVFYCPFCGADLRQGERPTQGM